MKIIELEETDSTNEFIKRMEPVSDVIVIAKRQTSGRGTKGRSFSSNEGGLYLSICRIYKNFSAENAFLIMVGACTAVCKTVEHFGVTPVIRWANDVLVDGKKICGTLIENTFSNGQILRSIVGMGINVKNELPEELNEIAISLSQLGKNPSVKEVKNELLKNLNKKYTLTDYKKYINWLGSEVILTCGEEQFKAVALDIEDDGRLIVLINGQIKKISSAEVSLRI